jgi:hypothetical protein
MSSTSYINIRKYIILLRNVKAPILVYFYTCLHEVQLGNICKNKKVLNEWKYSIASTPPWVCELLCAPLKLHKWVYHFNKLLKILCVKCEIEVQYSFVHITDPTLILIFRSTKGKNVESKQNSWGKSRAKVNASLAARNNGSVFSWPNFQAFTRKTQQLSARREKRHGPNANGVIKIRAVSICECKA